MEEDDLFDSSKFTGLGCAPSTISITSVGTLSSRTGPRSWSTAASGNHPTFERWHASKSVFYFLVDDCGEKSRADLLENFPTTLVICIRTSTPYMPVLLVVQASTSTLDLCHFSSMHYANRATTTLNQKCSKATFRKSGSRNVLLHPFCARDASVEEEDEYWEAVIMTFSRHCEVKAAVRKADELVLRGEDYHCCSTDELMAHLDLTYVLNAQRGRYCSTYIKLIFLRAVGYCQASSRRSVDGICTPAAYGREKKHQVTPAAVEGGIQGVDVVIWMSGRELHIVLLQYTPMKNASLKRGFPDAEEHVASPLAALDLMNRAMSTSQLTSALSVGTPAYMLHVQSFEESFWDLSRDDSRVLAVSKKMAKGRFWNGQSKF
ncbi:hypothetical protein SELMODRAFT_406735 [Selaginella moellendorffii]|uniref:Uncharacterized protein n=1 Tax=Selaginella moellendorffii TaxID=88036 RepID=D8R1A5_SELML|nr:hypothetical protein SELMODRAFT_406735 [Selaginella moellendorffii]